MCCQPEGLGTDIILLSTHIPRRGTQNKTLSVVMQLLFPKGVRPIRGATIYIVRIDKLGELAMARPCDDCWEDLENHGVRRVIYSIPKGYVMETISEL